jgi:hypothetical protein
MFYVRNQQVRKRIKFLQNLRTAKQTGFNTSVDMMLFTFLQYPDREHPLSGDFSPAQGHSAARSFVKCPVRQDFFHHLADSHNLSPDFYPARMTRFAAFKAIRTGIAIDV